MFGFLKDKLKKAIGAFSKSAESDIKEEKVEDKEAIEKAKQEEKKVLAKKPTKPTPKPAAKPSKPDDKTAPAPAPVKQSIPVEKPSPKPAPEKPKPTPPTPKEKPKEEPRITKVPEKVPVVPKISVERKEAKPIPKEKPVQEKPAKAQAVEPEKKGFFGRLFGKKEEVKEEIIREEIPAAAPVAETLAETIQEMEEVEAEIANVEEQIVEDRAYEEHAVAVAEEPVETAEEPSGFFGKLKDAFTKKSLTPEKFDELFWELELAMLENNVAVEVIEKIKADLRDELTSGKVSRMGIEDMITTRLRTSVEELFDVPTFDLVERIKAGPKPFKICMIGVNGSGKTTTLAKIIHMLKKENLTCIVAASDTFRAAAIDQLREHTDKLDVKLISQGYGADPAAVAFDAIKHAEAKGADVVLIDTAGRLHSNTNLMAELEKVVRVAKPDLKIFIGESITGNDCVEQAQVFNKLVGIDAIILSKADIDEKGGAAISVSYVTGKPILFLGMGQTYDDLVPFEKEKIIESLDLG
jgi:fused signal recognition particle receptor